MLGLLVDHSRRIRHVLDAWLLLALCPIAAAIPALGMLAGWAVGLVGLASAFRVGLEGRPLHCLLLLALFLAWMVASPFARGGATAAPLARNHPAVPLVAMEPPPAPRQGDRPDEEDVRAYAEEAPPSRSVRAERPATPPPPEVVPRDPREEALGIAERWVAARQRRDAEAMAGMCGEITEVAGKMLSKAEVRSFLVGSWEKEKGHSDVPFGQVEVMPDGEGWRALFRSRLTAAGTGRRHEATRQVCRAIVLTGDGTALRITRVGGAVMPSLREPDAEFSGMRASAIRSAVTGCLEADLAGDAESSMAYYAASVSYFGERSDRARMLAEKERYFGRWPRREETFLGSMAVATRTQDRAEASFRSRFRTESPERGEWCEGETEHRFVVRLSKGGVLIVEQRSRLIASRKGRL